MLNGKGRIIENASVYKGDFKNNKFHGKGDYIDNGYRYIGEFLEGIQHGYCLEIDLDGMF